MAVQEQPPANNQVQSLPDHVLPVVPILDAPRSEEQLLALSEAWGFNDALLELPQEVLPPIDTPADKYQALRQQALHGHIQGHKLANYQALIAELEALDDDYAKADGNRRKQRDVRDVQELVLNDIVRLRYGRKKPIANSANSPSEDPINGTGIATAALGTVVPRKNALSAKARLLLGATAVATVVSGCGEAPVGPVLLAPAPNAPAIVDNASGEAQPQATERIGQLVETQSPDEKDLATLAAPVIKIQVGFPEATDVPDEATAQAPEANINIPELSVPGVTIEVASDEEIPDPLTIMQCDVDGTLQQVYQVMVPVRVTDERGTATEFQAQVSWTSDTQYGRIQVTKEVIKGFARTQVARDIIKSRQQAKQPQTIHIGDPSSGRQIALKTDYWTIEDLEAAYGDKNNLDVFIEFTLIENLRGQSEMFGPYLWVGRITSYAEMRLFQAQTRKVIEILAQTLDKQPMDGNSPNLSMVGNFVGQVEPSNDDPRIDATGDVRHGFGIAGATIPRFAIRLPDSQERSDFWMAIVQNAFVTNPGKFQSIFDVYLDTYPAIQIEIYRGDDVPDYTATLSLGDDGRIQSSLKLKPSDDNHTLLGPICKN